MALQRLCATPGCDELTAGRRCQSHVRAVERARGTSTERGYDAAWQRIRKVILARDDYRCRLRLSRCTRIATTVDHIVPLSAGGPRLDPENLQAACSQCNFSKGGYRHHRPAWARGTA